MYKRIISLGAHPKDSFFLWGPRQTGKTSLLKSLYPFAYRIDLLEADSFRAYTQNPERLRHELLGFRSQGNLPALVVIDEVQKVPSLLDEAHWMIENMGVVFGLCGSSARKLKRGHANLLGGRAIRHELLGLTARELGKDFSLDRMLNHGTLPKVYMRDHPTALLRSYCSEYLKEEIAAEGLVRNLPAFSGFLEKVSLSDTEQIAYSSFARDCGVSVPTIKAYFEILFDTLLARSLPAYTRRPKRRVVETPKFYFFDVGVVNTLAKRGRIERGGELFGKAFENWVFHELSAFREYSSRSHDLSYWKLSTGTEVDFVLGDIKVAIEAKGSANITIDHLKGLREIKKDYPEIAKRIVVCLETRSRRTEDGIDILPYGKFIDLLWDGSVI